MDRIQCYFLTPTDQIARYLRRLADVSLVGGSCKHYHDAMARIEDAIGEENTRCDHDHGDSRWPTRCRDCGYLFQPEDEYELFTRKLYRRSDNNELVTLRDAPSGAMWHADWMLEYWPQYSGPDGHVLVVKTPEGEWCVDSRASNCDRKDDNVHKCWIRHGSPPNITVDKNGDTCSAGAGSIIMGSYHGFLRSGFLERC